MKKCSLIFGVILLSGIFLTGISCSSKKNTLPDFVKNDMKLVWSDEFDGTSEEPDSANWNFKEGANGWGNHEIQNYTKSRTNSYVSDGTLKIAAVKENGKWTSARMVTQYKKSMTYGYIEFRAKVPAVKGSWPALWLLPENNAYGTWPRSGEIDVMEASANLWADKVCGNLHCLSGHGGNPIASCGKEIKKMDKKWHTYAVNWTSEGITWYYDGTVLAEYRNPHNDEDNWMSWPYDQNFHILMNVAMGGNLGGEIDRKAERAVMEVDYIRWYQ